MTKSQQKDVLSFFCKSNVPTTKRLKTATAQKADGRKQKAVFRSLARPLHFGGLARGEHFSVFKKKHMEEAASVYNFLINCESYDEFTAHVYELKEVLNEGLYMYAISVASLHRNDLANTYLPPHWQIHTRSYFTRQAITEAITGKKKQRGVNLPPFMTGTVRDPEFKLAWWREDVGLNSHHYHWHLVYPYSGHENENGVRVTKNREGELFYYMHQQMVARYDAERLGVGLMRVKPYVDWNHPIQEGYNSHLTDYYGTHQYAARPANMYLTDVWTDPENPSLVSQQEYHYNRLLDAINTGKFQNSDQSTDDVNIDRLGAAVEASCSSPNEALYGNVHNIGHDLLASVADPDGRYKTASGVMGYTSTSARDPIFFRWHKFIDDLFVHHKLTLTPYSKEELAFDDINITDVSVKSKSTGEKDFLNTFMEEVPHDISHDMFIDTTENDPAHTSVYVTSHQVNHKEFKYTIKFKIRKDITRDIIAAFRIFMAPALTENGDDQELSLQRRLYIEMDKFVVKLQAKQTSITRSSTDSSVIKPTDLTIDQLKKLEDNPILKKRYCGCGWPEHMLLPRGTPHGMKFDLFVMVTDWKADRVTDLDKGTSYCGLKNKDYPDSRSMGFPFDRKIAQIVPFTHINKPIATDAYEVKTAKIETDRDVYTIADWVQNFSNMHTIPMWIKYN